MRQITVSLHPRERVQMNRRSPAELAVHLANPKLLLQIDSVQLRAVANERPIEEIAVERDENVRFFGLVITLLYVIPQ